MKISKAVGIDLGTTRSLIGIMDPDDKEILLWRNEIGKATIPSVIRWNDKEKQFDVGEDALGRRYEEPFPIHSIKRKMGFNVQVEHGDKSYNPEEISAEILKYLKTKGEDLVAKLNKPGQPSYVIDRAIVTIPAYFDAPKIEATRNAAILAGLQTLELLHEPTAAAIYYCWKNKIRDGIFMVYDLGGGTFDVSILKRVGNKYDVLATKGDNQLGGDTFDMALADWLIEQLNKSGYKLRLDVAKNPKDKGLYEYFVYKAEGIKTALSTENKRPYTDAACPYPDQEGKAIHAEIPVTRQQFEKLIEPFVDKTITICLEAIEDAKTRHKGTFNGLKDIDEVLLVGGSTWVPYVRKRVEEAFCAKSGEPDRAKTERVVQDEPDECVALGASLLASAFGGLVFEADEGVSLHLEGPGTAASDEYKARGRVFGKQSEVEDPAADSRFANYRISLIQDDSEEEQAKVDARGNFRFEAVFLEAGLPSKISFALATPDGKPVCTFSRQMRQAGATDGLGITIAAPNAKPLWIYVMNNKGEKVSKILVEAGENLPCKKDYSLTTTNVKKVMFELFQGDKLIKRFFQEFDHDQEKGTPIDLNIEMTKQGAIIVRSTVGSLDAFVMELEALVDEPITRKKADELWREFESVLQELPGAKRQMLAAKGKNLKTEIEKALAQGDEATALERYEEMNRAVEDSRPVLVKMDPPKDEFDERIAELKRKIQTKKEKIADWEGQLKNIETHVETAHAAYSEKDQQSLTEALSRIEGIEKYVQEIDPPPPTPPRFLVPYLAQRLTEMIYELMPHCSDEAIREKAENYLSELDIIPPEYSTDEEAIPKFPLLQEVHRFIFGELKRCSGRTEIGDGTAESNSFLPGLFQ